MYFYACILQDVEMITSAICSAEVKQELRTRGSSSVKSEVESACTCFNWAECQ